jgi:ribosomal protein S18 acetylase RimI-like enzyme
MMNITIQYKTINLEDVKQLFIEYQQEINLDLSFQDFYDELASLPGKYGPPLGSICVAYHDQVAIGCVALREFKDNVGEIKRLYVKPMYRNHHVALKLMHQIILLAKDLNYEMLLLDTLASMRPAITLYKKIGFYEIDAYYENPLKDVVYLRKDLISNQK